MTRLALFPRLLLAGAVALSALAAEKPRPLPKGLPPYGPLAPFRAPRVEVKKLANGMTLWLVPRPGFPKVALAFAVRGGMAEDPKPLPGLSQLLVATIDQGTKTRSARQIAEEIQAAGGDLAGNARADAIVLSTDVLAGKTDAALTVLADILENATFPDSEVDLAKHNAADNLRAQEAEPDFLARRALAKAIFGEHPYNVISPTQESISKATPADLRQEYARRFRPDQTALIAVGDFDAAKLGAEIERQFGGWQAPSEAPVSDVGKPPEDNPHAVLYVARAGSVQTTLALGSFGPTERDPDYEAAEVANAIYGGMFGSRLVVNIREDKGYTYSPGSFLQGRRDAGLFETRADVRNAVTGASVNEIEYELNRMATTSPAEDEMDRARRYLVGIKAIILQLQGSVASQLATLWIMGLPPEELGLESEKIQKVTAQEVDAASRKYFPFSRQTVVAVGEAKVIEEQLGVFGMAIKPVP
ncbi:MAG TPA: pitrilysin family protein [Terriglobia bacterium]|nr:pitrilysin family protein [Terriglobia bacterium]